MKLCTGKARNFHLSLPLLPPPYEYCLPLRVDFLCRVSLRTYARKFCARNWNRSNVCNPYVNVKVERGSILTFRSVVRLHVCLAFVFSIGNSTPTCFSLTEKGAGAGRSSTQQRGSHFMKKNRSLSHSWLEYPRCNRDWRSCVPCLEKTRCCACERRASQPPF